MMSTRSCINSPAPSWYHTLFNQRSDIAAPKQYSTTEPNAWESPVEHPSPDRRNRQTAQLSRLSHIQKPVIFPHHFRAYSVL